MPSIRATEFEPLVVTEIQRWSSKGWLEVLEGTYLVGGFARA